MICQDRLGTNFIRKQKKTEDSYHMSSPFVLREPPQIMFMALASPSVRHVALLAPVQRIDFASKTPSHTRGSRSSPSTTPARADKNGVFSFSIQNSPHPSSSLVPSLSWLIGLDRENGVASKGVFFRPHRLARRTLQSLRPLPPAASTRR
jgi:hypothetical protein